MKKRLFGKILILTTFILSYAGCSNPESGYSNPEKSDEDVTKIIQKDSTTFDFGINLDYSSEDDLYIGNKDINEILGTDLPNKDDKLELSVKLNLTAPAKSVKGRFIFVDANNKEFKSDKTQLTLNSTAVNGIIKGKSPCNAKQVYVEIFADAEIDEESHIMFLAESGKGVPSSGKIFSVKPCEQGIKIIIADNVKLQTYGGGWISISGSPFRISINVGDNSKKEYIFPFVEKNQKVYVSLNDNLNTDDSDNYKWIRETLSCTTGGGLDISNYINYSALKNSKPSINIIPDEQLKITYKIENTNVIKDSSIFEKAQLVFNVILGEKDWSHTEYWGAPIIDLLNSNLLNNIEMELIKVPSTEKLNEFNNKYYLYVTPELVFKDYPDTNYEFDFGSIWAD